ncbi:probable receptor-like protein kinase At5g24010 [Impatiens glandulifera]|uniref:probable receptor-like protein kinase At5g24010 n=1 Tax=Impatiens glandulifera TaxID=253017 RepID=UPI001FB0773D|nr:probable receptor-like protein kinase At5g24010 [Impatiens glandulifera]
MEETHTSILLLLLHLVSLSFLSHWCSAAFSPPDDYLINCGSSSNVTMDNRIFVGDSAKQIPVRLSAGKSLSINNPNYSANSPKLYETARVSTAALSYEFGIYKNGTHLVRLHFSPFTSQNFDLKTANFTVFANGFSILKTFSAPNTVVKEFILMINVDKFNIMLVPTDSETGFAFVNGIELFSVPDDLIPDTGAKLIGPNGLAEFNDLSSQVLETVHRINVGGPRLTPFNDTLWRNWFPDEDFLILKQSAKIVRTTHIPNYQPGGASREIAPDNVYMTAQQMNKDNLIISTSLFNVTWHFPVVSVTSVYLIRLHFSDIVSKSLNQLYFNVFINGFLAYKDFDLSTMTNRLLSSPYYTDFVADTNGSGFISVSIGPSELSSPSQKNAILNGVEIMRMMDIAGLGSMNNKRNNNKGKWVLVSSILGGSTALCLILLVVLFALWRLTKKQKRKLKPIESLGWTPVGVYGGSMNSRLSEGIPFANIQIATNNFDKSLIIGSGGFGTVYKGILGDNINVAVKRGVPGSRQGLPEFHTEITVLSKIRHRHLVSLVGFCEEQSEMILVYEYMEKGSLKNHLYGSSTFSPLSWKKRLEICIGAARGLHYLHTGSAEGIIHRDIKSTNILLDDNYVAKVADFGLSRAGPCLDETHVSTGVKGSFGYLDPEYFRRQQLTDKSDVYSFGVVLLEVLCARPAVDTMLAREQVNLAEWAMEWQKKGILEQIMDPFLVGNIKVSSLKKFGETAEKCLADYGVDRPTMGDVLWNLEHALQLQEGGGQNGNFSTGEASTSTEVGPRIPLNHIIAGDEDNEENGNSEMATNKVFSQLINSEGR